MAKEEEEENITDEWSQKAKIFLAGHSINISFSEFQEPSPVELMHLWKNAGYLCPGDKGDRVGHIL